MKKGKKLKKMGEVQINTADKVSHNNKHWISTVDNNVWEPGVYDWNEVV